MEKLCYLQVIAAGQRLEKLFETLLFKSEKQRTTNSIAKFIKTTIQHLTACLLKDQISSQMSNCSLSDRIVLLGT